MADHTIHLGFDESVDIVLPGGQKINVVLSYLEPGEQLPEIDVMFPRPLSVNCFGEGWSPAPACRSGDQHVRLAKHIIVPVDIEA